MREATPEELNKTLQEERDMLLDILSCVDPGALADALYEAGYDTRITIPLLEEADIDLRYYRRILSSKNQ